MKNFKARPVYWRSEIDLENLDQPVLAFGKGRSYGDSCLNDGGMLLDTTGLNRFIHFDEKTGYLRCEAGVTFAEILKVFVPRGWFLPVTPGTKYVTVGGAIANDIHGKGHHKNGTFGCHVRQLELLRSNGERLICSQQQNRDLFRATIAGLGLTGLIAWAEFRLKPIKSDRIESETIKFDNLDAFFHYSQESNEAFEYTAAWLDCTASGAALGRGHFIRGNHSEKPCVALRHRKTSHTLGVPFDLPNFALNRYSIKLFNQLYFHRLREKTTRKIIHYEPFFYPLDGLNNWNRIYGKRGFLQHQCVVPFENGHSAIHQIVEKVVACGQGSFLTVLKTFGDHQSPGMLSFPRKGVTLAMDFANNGKSTLRLLDGLDAIVRAKGGAVYPAKDARMSKESFEAFYPNFRDFEPYIDPKFSSSFWRRVRIDAGAEK